MPTIRIQRDHQLSHEQARARVERLAGLLQSELDASCHWDRDVLRFSRSGASGHVALAPERIEVEVKLGMLLAPLRGRVEQAIEEHLDKHLG